MNGRPSRWIGASWERMEARTDMITPPRRRARSAAPRAPCRSALRPRPPTAGCGWARRLHRPPARVFRAPRRPGAAGSTCGHRARPCDELMVVAALDDDPLIEHDDLLGVDNGREPMRDDERGAVLRDLLERILDVLLGV